MTLLWGKIHRASTTSELKSCHHSSIPAPTVPPTAAIMDVFGDAFTIAIVCFVVNISMAKLFATKYKYQISPNQVGQV